jgi:GTP pyrophosphokinase
MIGAKVNGRLVNIDYKIQNGDRIEIITSQNSKGPSRDWLNIVKSTQAKNKINQWFRSAFKEENIQKGRELLEKYCKSKGINWTEINKPEYQAKILRKYGFQKWENVLATIGHGALKESQVANRMQEEYRKDHPLVVTDDDVLKRIENTSIDRQPLEHHSRSGIVVKGLYDIAVHLSKCCSPVPGDEIVGFVTRGRGVSIHRTDCINMMNLSELDKARLIEAEWSGSEEEEGSTFLAEINIYGNNRTGLLVDLTRIFTERSIDINSIHSKTSKQGVATISIAFETKGKDQVNGLIEKLRQVESVIDIERTTG